MVSSPNPPVKVSASSVPWISTGEGGEPSGGKLGLKLSATRDDAWTFFNIATVIPSLSDPALPSSSNLINVSSPD